MFWTTYSQNETFINIKLHLPHEFPLSYLVLHKNSVIIVPDGAVDNTVVCEETSRTVHRHISEVIYVREEQDRSQNGALGNTRDYRFRVR